MNRNRAVTGFSAALFHAPVALVAVTLSACGFQLEGMTTLPTAAATTYIDAEDRHTDFYLSLRDALRARGAAVVDSPREAGAVLRIIDDSTDQRMLSVSARNIPREFEIFYEVTFSFRAGEDTLIESESLIATRSYTYDETLVLGKSTEEDVLRESLAQDLARQVLRRIAMDRGTVAANQN
ncbi:MAG TPA: LPS assembly lipoprotein LptE [Gammaproteobacteria bacterium]